MTKVRIDVDETPVANAKARTDRAVQSMKITLEQVAQIGTSVAIAFGATISQSMQLGIQAARHTINLVTTTTAAALTTPAGILLAAAKIGTIAALLNVIIQLETGRAEATTQTMALVSMFSAIRY